MTIGPKGGWAVKGNGQGAMMGTATVIRMPSMPSSLSLRDCIPMFYPIFAFSSAPVANATHTDMSPGGMLCT